MHLAVVRTFDLPSFLYCPDHCIGKLTIDRYADIHAVCGVVKYWFRVLPETVIPESFFDPILDAARIPDLNERLTKIREIVHNLPRAHYYVLKRFSEHLDRFV